RCAVGEPQARGGRSGGSCTTGRRRARFGRSTLAGGNRHRRSITRRRCRLDSGRDRRGAGARGRRGTTRHGERGSDALLPSRCRRRPVNAATIQQRFAQNAYVASDDLATALELALALEKPLLVEGPAGVGKTECARVLAQTLRTRL